MDKFIQFRRYRALEPQSAVPFDPAHAAGPATIEKVTEYITISEADAIKAYRTIHPDRKVSDWVALDGYMSANNARSAPPPLELGVGIAEYMKVFVAACGGIRRAAKQLSIHENVIVEVLSEKRNKLPSYVLRKMGVKQVVTLLPVDETA